jgi:hypothetical protein
MQSYSRPNAGSVRKPFAQRVSLDGGRSLGGRLARCEHCAFCQPQPWGSAWRIGSGSDCGAYADVVMVRADRRSCFRCDCTEIVRGRSKLRQSTRVRQNAANRFERSGSVTFPRVLG